MVKVNEHLYMDIEEIKEHIKKLGKEKQDMIIAAIEKKDDLTLKELLEKQKRLDQFIVDNKFIGTEIDGSDEVFLTDRLLALSVEVSELANATRCFKYWSNKEAESKERILDEYADILHLLLSVASTLSFTSKDIEQAYLKKHKENYKRQERGY